MEYKDIICLFVPIIFYGIILFIFQKHIDRKFQQNEALDKMYMTNMRQFNKKVRQVLAHILVVCVLASSIVLPVSAEKTSENETQTMQQTSAGIDSTAVTASGTDSVGDLFAEVLNEEMESQDDSAENKVLDVTLNNNTAQVTFQTSQDAKLLVAIYDDEGKKLITCADTNVLAEDTTAEVTFDEATIPEYFLLRAFLTDLDTKKPISLMYETDYYTQEMQEFLSKTVDDFQGQNVYNFDEDKTNNFAVYNDDINVIYETETENMLLSVNEAENTYILQNPSDKIKNLQDGDIVSYETLENKVFIFTIKSAVLNENQIVLTAYADDEKDVSLETIFSYIKIDSKAEPVQADDNSQEELENTQAGVSDDISVVAVSDNSAEAQTTSGNSVEEPSVSQNELSATEEFGRESDINLGPTVSKEDKKEYSFVNQTIKAESGNVSGSVTIDGKITLAMKSEVSVFYAPYISFQVKLTFDYTAQFDLKISGEAEAEVELPISLEFMPVLGVHIKVTPSFIVGISGEISLNTSITGTIGMQVSTGILGTKNSDLTTTPVFTTEVKAEVTLKIGIGLTAQASIIDEDIAGIGLHGAFGGKIKAAIGTGYTTEKSLTKHSCKTCIDGELDAWFEVSIFAKVGNDDDLKIESKPYGKDDIKLADFYYSFDHAEFGVGECPYEAYRVLIKVIDKNGKAVDDANIVDQDVKTGLTGFATCYYSGKQTITAEKDGIIGSITEYIDTPMGVTVILGQISGSVVIEKGNVEKLSLGGANVAAITSDKYLYVWGCNTFGQSGTGTTTVSTTPVKVMENVREVASYNKVIAAITYDDDLYMWGSNSYARTGNGNTSGCQTVPKKILSNVKSVTIGNYRVAAITNDGELYIWGYSSKACGLGNLSLSYITTPTKLLDDVKSVSLSNEFGAAICENKTGADKNYNLYMWGHNYHGVLGDKTINDQGLPFAVELENVSDVSLGSGFVAAITEDGALYTWGENDHGQLGDGLSVNSQKPIKIMDNISSVTTYNDTIAVIDKRNNLYMWGSNSYGECGIEDMTDIYTPQKILIGVKEIKLDQGFSMALKSNGTLWTWGCQEHGQLGNGVNSSSIQYSPVKIAEKVASIYMAHRNGKYGGYIDKQQVLYLWGSNHTGQVEKTAKLSVTTPYKITLPTATSTDTASIDYVSAGTTLSASKDGKYTGLRANQVYNFYVVESEDLDDVLASDNLLYIWQGTTDENGTLEIDYEMRRECANSYIFAECMSGISLADATISMENIVYNKEEQTVTPTLTMNNVALEEGIDYQISGDIVVKDIGDYTITVKGIGKYGGSAKVLFKVYCDHQYTESVVEPTETVDGYTLHTCTICEESYKDNYVNKLTPDDPTNSTDPMKPTDPTNPTNPDKTSVPAKKNTVLKDKNNNCKVKVVSDNVKNPTVTYIGCTKSTAKTIKIPSTVKIDGITYKVVSVASKALAKNKKVTKVVIGKNVKTIGSKAFQNCTALKTVQINSTVLKSIGASAFSGDKKLKSVTIKSTKLKSSSVGKNAFKGTSTKLKIKVPKTKVKAYKKFLVKKGNKKVKVTK